ncbi:MULTISPECIES: PorP/SprF family type IX secretion system membrane protein [Rufibacter]|uniref:Type IX secretion system PorP/SprF family membrane protein n=1 Tax=Rufibacter quisquiliarum TaxID=1549639 RepID=A0A839G878_9BACT|nr:MULTISPECIES: PorP/SprF family type IX secretion system membrane protein [Rufibacter]MBA9075644.1 type IX secretion system PorP/SprF family membrane protein [Rufibacter quisquiliarum]
MKLKQILVVAFLLMAGVAQAQIEKHRMTLPRLYQQNYFYLNPAFAGSEGKREFGLNTHLNSIKKEGSTSPLSVIAHYQGAVGDTTRNGIGVVAVYDQFGPYWLGRLGLTYAKRFRLGEYSSIGVGTQLSAKYLNIDLAEATRGLPVKEQMVGHDNDLRPDVDVGVWLNIRNFYAGATFASLLQPNFNLTETAEREDVREVFLTAGYKLELADEFSITPSVFFDKPLKGGEFGQQYSALATYKFLSLGATHRNGGQFSGQQAPWSIMGGVNISERVSFLGSYDLTKDKNGYEPDPQVEANLRFRF